MAEGPEMGRRREGEMSRRDFLGGLGATGAVLAAGPAIGKERGVDGERALEQMAVDYKKAREHVKASQLSDGIFSLEYYLPGTQNHLPYTENIVDIGRFNTEGHGPAIEEDGLLEVLRDQGFQDFRSFAEAFNTTFAHRADDAKNLLTEGAQKIDESFARQEDILIGDEGFKNMRLAVQIFITDKLLRQPIGDSIQIAGQEFQVKDIKGKMPNINLREMLFHPRATVDLATVLEHLPDEAPEFESGGLEEARVKEILRQYSYVYESNGAPAYGLLLAFALPHTGEPPRVPLYEALADSQHGRVSKEVWDYFYNLGAYGYGTGAEDSATRRRDFAHMYAYVVPGGENDEGFNTAIYADEGP